MGVEIVGLARINALMLDMVEKTVVAALRADADEADAIIVDAIPITPIMYGFLRASMKPIEPTNDRGLVVGGVIVGGPSAPYAMRVHERLDVHHDPPTQAKFLEKPTLEAGERFAGRMVNYVRDALR